ncbi:MAG: TonB-dependent receptor plug domain-containing protein [bacterium]
MLFLGLRNRLIIFSICLITTTALSQEVRLSGIVRDLNTHQEIRSVNIYIKGSEIGTTSDFAGRYRFLLLHPTPKMVVVFRHIAYEPREISLDSLRTLYRVDLQPRVIPLGRVEIEEPGIQRLEIERDLPQTISVIEARNFEIRGYVDAGDLLRTDHSVQVDEELSGKKTLAIRGGNPDEVVVLYNGIKMNNAYNNVFDLSLIDLEDIERFELIKGSNTALYGPEAFSGVINVVPKVQQDYNIRFQQRLGTYRSGNWGLHLYKKFDRVSGSYSIKRGGLRRHFVDVADGQAKLENTSLHHTANIYYDLPTNAEGQPRGSFGAMWIYTDLDYDNQRDKVTLSNFNHLFSLKYSGDLLKFKDLELSASYKNLKEESNRNINDRAFYLNAQKRFEFTDLDILFAYQFQQNKLDFLEQIRKFDLQRRHHGFVSIVKYHGETGSNFLRTIDVDLSIRHDRLNDRQSDFEGEGNDLGQFEKNNWQETMFKFALNFSGYRDDLLINGFLSFGANTKFPTLFQQVSSPLLVSSPATQPNLNPEKNRSFELGVNLIRDVGGQTSVYGWQVSANYFQNHYDNKFRTFITPRDPVPKYDNVQDAKISGFEAKSSIFLFRKKVTVDLGLSKYFISEKAAFPFKSDHKRTINLNVDHAGYSFQLHWFKEGEQTGWLSFQNGEFAEISLPDNMNIDMHLSKTFEISKLKFFINASGRNLLNDDFVLEGIAIRDRRFYLTLGAQY